MVDKFMLSGICLTFIVFNVLIYLNQFEIVMFE